MPYPFLSDDFEDAHKMVVETAIPGCGYHVVDSQVNIRHLKNFNHTPQLPNSVHRRSADSAKKCVPSSVCPC